MLLGLTENEQIDPSIEFSHEIFFDPFWYTPLCSLHYLAKRSFAKNLPSPKTQRKIISCENCHQGFISAEKASTRIILIDFRGARDTSNLKISFSRLKFWVSELYTLVRQKSRPEPQKMKNHIFARKKISFKSYLEWIIL